MKDTLEFYLSNPIATCGAIFLVSLLALIFAFGMEFMMGLKPCVLCIYQRVPYFITTGLGVIGLATLYREEWINYAAYVIFFTAITFFVGGVIAFYHVGVEQHWWASALEGCAVEFEKGSIEELKAMIDKKIPARCDEIPWSFLGVSMAGYNVLASLILAFLTGYSAVIIRRTNEPL